MIDTSYEVDTSWLLDGDAVVDYCMYQYRYDTGMIGIFWTALGHPLSSLA